MKKEKKYKVKIHLLEDNMTSSIKALSLANEIGGKRITSSKGGGSWKLVKEFICELTLNELKEYEIKDKKLVK